ncbi:MAG: hypothetical protein ACE37E_04520 [Hyphomicrobiales bacterium]
MRAWLIASLAFVLAAVSPAYAQSPVITFYETGADLRFEAEDVLSVQSVDQEGHGAIALTLSAAQSQRLQAFTQSLVGSTIMTVSHGHVLSADIHVRTAMSGPVIHVSGADKAAMRQRAERLEGLRSAGEPLLVTYEQVARLDIDAAAITAFQDANGPDGSVLRLHVTDAMPEPLPAEADGWVASIGGVVIEDWSVAEDNGVVAVTLHALTPAQRAALQP